MTTEIDATYCEQLGKLFYAIAMADNNIEKVEYDVFKSKVKTIDLQFLESGLQFDIDIFYFITSMFNKLYLNDAKAEDCFNDFISYKRRNEKLFPEAIRKVILKIASEIASSFSKQNKSELIMLVNLNIEFKKFR